jgi:siroheme synthase
MTPAAAVCNGTRDGQRCVISTLGEIANAAAEAAFEGPVLFYVGRVVEMMSVLAEPARRPASIGSDVHAHRP